MNRPHPAKRRAPSTSGRHLSSAARTELGTASSSHSRTGSWLSAALNRLEVIVSFLAVLELMKQHKVVAYQRELFGDFVIEPVPDAETSPAPTEADDDAEPSFIEPE